MYGRRIEVNITGVNKTLRYPELDIFFSGSFDFRGDPNEYEIKIFGLSRTTAAEILVDQDIILNAGHEGDVGFLTQGIITGVSTEKSGPERITVIKFIDTSVEWINARVSRTYSAGTLASTILNEILSDLGMEVGPVVLVNDITYIHGKSIHGKIVDVVKAIARDCSTPIDVVAGKISIRTSESGERIGYVLNSSTGLIESPRVLDDKNNIGEYRVKAIFNHLLRYKNVIRLESQFIEGDYVIVGGSYHEDYTCDLDILRV